ncbi:hypothetical protein ACQPXH_14405 [Nocardia sp. CA-135953]|uniref:hypothetical protein n=1 Tax=Nocardia sp. CA-135953 TaxID=3239978 RepID=UPI003D970F6B
MKSSAALEERVEAQQWHDLTEEIDAYGCAQTGPLLSPDECAEFAPCNSVVLPPTLARSAARWLVTGC